MTSPSPGFYECVNPRCPLPYFGNTRERCFLSSGPHIWIDISCVSSFCYDTVTLWNDCSFVRKFFLEETKKKTFFPVASCLNAMTHLCGITLSVSLLSSGILYIVECKNKDYFFSEKCRFLTFPLSCKRERKTLLRKNGSFSEEFIALFIVLE